MLTTTSSYQKDLIYKTKRLLDPLPQRTLEWMLKVKSSYNFFIKAS